MMLIFADEDVLLHSNFDGALDSRKVGDYSCSDTGTIGRSRAHKGSTWGWERHPSTPVGLANGCQRLLE